MRKNALPQLRFLHLTSFGVRIVLALSMVLAIAPALSAQEAADRAAGAQQLLERLDQHGDLTLRSSTLEGALFTISELWGINIVAGKVEGEVNGVFKDAPLREILDSILISNGYAYRPVGKSLVISRMQDLGQINPFFVSETITIGAANVNEVVEAAKLMSTPRGQVRPLPSAGAVLVVDFPDRIEKIRILIQQIDATTRGMATPGVIGPAPQQLEVAYFRTHFIPAGQAGTALDVVLSPVGRISALENEDRLLVVDYAENIKMVESVLARIDRPRPQVNIKALIYDIGLSDLEEIGVNWGGITSGDSTAGIPTGGNGLSFNTVTKQPFASTSEGGSFTFFSLNNNFNVQAVILALQKAEDSRLLADPNVTVLDNETANIESVSEIPYQQLTQTSAGGNIGTTAFKEAGIKLQVTPKISRDGTIDLTVIPEFSRLSGFTPGDNQPIIDTRRATTRIRVQSGQTMMIAGLRQRNDVGDFKGIPLLKDVRFFGHLFRSHDTQIEESELVVFITPEIVGFSDPLSPRDQLTASTVNCRLDHIPTAEGCPPSGQCNSGCNDGSCSPVVSETEVYESYEGPSMEVMPPSPTEATPQQVIEEIIPQSANRSTQDSDLKYPLATKKPLRRLPSIDDGIAPLLASEGAVDASDRRVEIPATERLRPDYDSRFRAIGGVYGNQQRVAERPSEPGASEPTEKKSWLDRVMLR